MHLLPSYWTTTNTRKRKKGKKSKSLLAAEKEHQKYLKRMGIGKSKAGIAQLVERGTCNAQVVGSTPTSGTIPSYHPSMSKKEENTYTGDEIIGIAQMHKSNAVPIRGKKQATEVARMRR
tara:strand:- start:956 stop:1315 length:360 start_codon:yes stop_codon:yes gene_type:complete